MYFVKAVDHGRDIDVATVDTAKQAVIKFLDALDQYNRVWVSDEAGNDLSMDDLTRLAQEEER